MPLDPRWVAAPPEIVALIFEGGPGPGSIVAYASVMATEAASHQMGMAVSAANIATTSASWTGLAGTANVARGTALNMGGLEPLAAHCAKHVMLAQAAVDAYTMAAPSVIPSGGVARRPGICGVPCAPPTGSARTFPGLHRRKTFNISAITGRRIPASACCTPLLSARSRQRAAVLLSVPPPVTQRPRVWGRRAEPGGTDREHRGPGRRPGIDHRRRTARECWIGAFWGRRPDDIDARQGAADADFRCHAQPPTQAAQALMQMASGSGARPTCRA